MQALCKDYGVEIRVTAGGRPQSNGIAEAYVKNFKTKLTSLILEKRNILACKIKNRFSFPIYSQNF